MGGSYAFVRIAAANLRATNDPYNEMFGGLAAGAMAGLRSALRPPLYGLDSDFQQNEHFSLYLVTV